MTPNTKEALLDAAERLFTENGYNVVSTRDLADAAGANLAAIKYHFGSKAKLFIEVVHRLMNKSGVVEARLDYSSPITSPQQAAKAIGSHIFGFFTYLLNCGRPQACRMMLRESCTDHSDDPEMFETLIAQVTDNFLRPLEDSLVRAIQIMKPELSLEECLLGARSITGQCAYYGSHQIFIERIDGTKLSTEEQIRKKSGYVTRFSFRGLDCSEELLQWAYKGMEEAIESSSRGCETEVTDN
jgi:AcrR family transcriptional regulator